MPRRKKIILPPDLEKEVAPRKSAPKKIPENKNGQTAKGAFVLAAGLLFMLIVSLIFTKVFLAASVPARLSGSITYEIDKKIYETGEEMRAAISNNSNKAIYLAPCRYFNEFQKKTGDKWRNVFLSPCDSVLVQASDAFEKISGKVEEKISTGGFGAGTWRGVSDIYFDCRKAKPESCGSMKTIYTEEFKVENKQTEGASYNQKEPQL